MTKCIETYSYDKIDSEDIVLRIDKKKYGMAFNKILNKE